MLFEVETAKPFKKLYFFNKLHLGKSLYPIVHNVQACQGGKMDSGVEVPSPLETDSDDTAAFASYR